MSTPSRSALAEAVADAGVETASDAASARAEREGVDIREFTSSSQCTVGETI